MHAFDPTPSSIDMLDGRDLPESFAFHPWAVTAKDGSLTFSEMYKAGVGITVITWPGTLHIEAHD